MGDVPQPVSEKKGGLTMRQVIEEGIFIAGLMFWTFAFRSRPRK